MFDQGVFSNSKTCSFREEQRYHLQSSPHSSPHRLTVKASFLIFLAPGSNEIKRRSQCRKQSTLAMVRVPPPQTLQETKCTSLACDNPGPVDMPLSARGMPSCRPDPPFFLLSFFLFFPIYRVRLIVCGDGLTTE